VTEQEHLTRVEEAIRATVAKQTARVRRGAGIGRPHEDPGPDWIAEGVCEFEPPRTLVSTRWLGPEAGSRWSDAGPAATQLADALSHPTQMFYDRGVSYAQLTDTSWGRRPWSPRVDARVSDDPLWTFDVLARALESGNATARREDGRLEITVDLTRPGLEVNPPDRTLRQRLSPRYRRLDRATPIDVRLSDDGLVQRVSFLYLLSHQPKGWWITTEFLEFGVPVAWPNIEPAASSA
jgi:hypothetical protein